MSYIQLHHHLIAKKATKTNSCSKLKNKYLQQLMFDHFFQEFGAASLRPDSFADVPVVEECDGKEGNGLRRRRNGIKRDRRRGI